MRIQTSDFPKSVSNALLVELRKKYWSTFARNYMSETCEMKVSSGLSWGFKPQIHRFCCQILYLMTYTKLVQLFFLSHNKLLSSVCFLSVWSTGYTDAAILLLESNDCGNSAIESTNHYELLCCSGKDWIRNIKRSWSMTELFKSGNTLFLSKDIKCNWILNLIGGTL